MRQGHAEKPQCVHACACICLSPLRVQMCMQECQSWLSLSETPQTSTCTVTYNHQWRGKGRGGRLGKDSTGLHFSRILFKRISGNDCALILTPPPLLSRLACTLCGISTRIQTRYRVFEPFAPSEREIEGEREGRSKRERGGEGARKREREKMRVCC